MPIYDISAAAEALDVPAKQLDNILSRNEIPGVEKKCRGVTRRLSGEAIATTRLALDLARSLGMPVGAALRTALVLTQADRGLASAGPFATLTVDVAALRRSTSARLDAAVESVGRRRRGRPAGPGRSSDPDAARQ
jgi:hypothetical protein